MQLPIHVNRADAQPLQVQIYEGIREMILGGVLKAGQRLPSSRAVADQFGVARNTVVLAYERLAAEDYITSRVKAGIFVNDRLPDANVLARNNRSVVLSKGRRIRLGAGPSFSSRYPALWQDRDKGPALDFFVGRPSPDSFPAAFWQRSASRHLAYSCGAPTRYGDPRGLLALREAIADHLSATRGIAANADQVVVTAGIQGALNLLARIFFTDNRRASVAVENPGYQGAAFLFGSYGAQLFPIQVDDHGLVVSELDQFPGSLVYVTPSHQFPTGVTMTLDRRLHLLDWAYRTGSYIIEDDYDSDFRYDGPPLTALAGLDKRGWVIYLGTFSKSIGAGIRIGYAVLPPHLVEQAHIAKALLDHGAPWLEQAVLADFIAEGGFLRHLRQIRRTYKATRDALVTSIHQHFPDSVLSGQDCGMHMMWTLPPELPTAKQVQRLALNVGVGLYPLPDAAVFQAGRSRQWERSVVVGYTALSQGQVCTAIARVAAALAATGHRPLPSGT